MRHEAIDSIKLQIFCRLKVGTNQVKHGTQFSPWSAHRMKNVVQNVLVSIYVYLKKFSGINTSRGFARVTVFLLHFSLHNKRFI